MSIPAFVEAVLNLEPGSDSYNETVDHINLKLVALGHSPVGDTGNNPALRLSNFLIKGYQEHRRLLSGHQSPVDQRIQVFLDQAFGEHSPRLPTNSFDLDHPGLARVLSFPLVEDHYKNSIIESYRVRQGVLHNPVNDKRTTKGVFHVTDYGLPIADDKKSVPVETAARLFTEALRPPEDALRLPFSSGSDNPVHCWLSLLIKPVVCPGVDGFILEKTSEVRFFAPASMVANLDFVESIFGNAGDPYLLENDSGIDVEHWTGHTGCVILAPHLTSLKKKDLGLPHAGNATERQRRDGMCWEDPDELYNDGTAFKLTLRDEKGRIATVIADNYFGYCKKEVKTQISFAANLYGLVEEEHAGGAIAFPSYDLGLEFDPQKILPKTDFKFSENIKKYGDFMECREDGYAVDRNYPDVFYVPENSVFDLTEDLVSWKNSDGGTNCLVINPGLTYVLPSGYRVEMRRSLHSGTWRLVGTVGEGFLCHKPCTVSGGGKSEISKPLHDVIVEGTVYVADLEEDLKKVRDILDHDFSGRFTFPKHDKILNRTILSPLRSMGSTIKLLTPLEDFYTPEYNQWLMSIPQHLKELVYILKREYRPEWGDNWEQHFSVDNVDGRKGNSLFLNGEKLKMNYLRLGFDANGRRRLFGLREDFEPAMKIIAEDDITASIVVPVNYESELGPGRFTDAAKFVHNCEYRLFQRPDDAIIRGFDQRTELDFIRPGNFLSNYAPLSAQDINHQIDRTLEFDKYTKPMQQFLEAAAKRGKGYACSSSNPRIVDGKPTKNPRYLQLRPDLEMQKEVYVSQVCTRLRRSLSPGKPVFYPVRAFLPGRRNNPPDQEAGIPALCCFAPIHYLELPELFMDFITSLTGKSPSTTGAGSEGAMTKAPFNALLPIHDLNTSLVSYACTGQGAFITSAGWIGPKYQVDHDISLLIPEVWSRLRVSENSPESMIQEGYLERIEDYEKDGHTIPAGRLGYRITSRFAHEYFGRIFHDPDAVFPRDMLKPELQDAEIYAQSVVNVAETHKRVAQAYFRDGSIELACPPLRALLEIMADDNVDDKRLHDPGFRKLFNPSAILHSDWYMERIDSRLDYMKAFWEGRIAYLKEFQSKPANELASKHLGIQGRIEFCKEARRVLDEPGTKRKLHASLGREPSFQLPAKKN